MEDFSKLEQQLRSDDRIKAAADSPEGRRISASIDQQAVEKAAREGDSAALKDILTQVLSTPDGKALAEKLRQAMQGK
jgi:hypothetical protein